MPQKKVKKRSLSVLKNARQNLRRRVRHQAVRSAVRTILKKVRKEKEIEKRREFLPLVYATLDKAAKKGSIPHRTADRLKSRVARISVASESSSPSPGPSPTDSRSGG
ncbi:MAG: 30S ribosomal protein S20 [Candidatus Edwardsbacteria bacterium]